MSNKCEYLIDKIFEKLKKGNLKKINLKKDEFRNFIFFLIKKS